MDFHNDVSFHNHFSHQTIPGKEMMSQHASSAHFMSFLGLLISLICGFRCSKDRTGAPMHTGPSWVSYLLNSSPFGALIPGIILFMVVILLFRPSEQYFREFGSI
jgi:hypothetical protein